jgi:epsilon-lactone hydrolase
MRNPLRYCSLVRTLLNLFDCWARLPKDTTYSRTTLGSTPIEQITPIAGIKSRSIFLYIHGGAYVLPLNNLYRKFAAEMARDTGMKVILIDYSLIPESPYPIALEECLIAYQTLLQQGMTPEHILLGGDSAGGGLVLALLLKIKEGGLPFPTAAVALSPWVDLCLTGPSLKTRREQDPLLNPDQMPYIVQAYLSASDRQVSCQNPFVSAVYGNLEGLPPLLMMVGENEILWDDTFQFAKKARTSDVKVEVVVGKNMPHIYPILFPKEPESLTSYARLINFLKIYSS